jgi:uncharacterized protein
MGVILGRFTGFFELLPERLIANRKKTWFLFFIILILCISGLPRMKLDMSLESWFQTDDPAVVAFTKFKDNFGGDNSVYIVYRAKDGDVFSDQSLSLLSRLQDELNTASMDALEDENSLLDHILEIKSLINVSYMEVDGDSLNSRDFIGEELPQAKEEVARLRKEALAHKDYPLFYLSKDSQYGGIYIRTDYGAIPEEEGDLTESDAFETDLLEAPAGDKGEENITKYKTTDMGEFSAFAEEIDRIIEKPEYQAAFEFYPVGNPYLMKVFNHVLNVEMSYILLGTMVLMLGTLYYLFRSFSAVIWPIIIVILTMISTLGIVSWLGVTMSLMMSLIVMLILVVGIADSIHILSGYVFFRKKRVDHMEALKAVMKRSGFACMLTSVTTAAGLLAMIFVPIPPIAVFGYTAALGVFLAFLYTVLLLPLMLNMWQPVSKKEAARIEADETKISLIQKLLAKIEPFSYGFPKTVLLIFFVVTAFAVYGLTKVKVDSNMVELIKEGHPMRVAFDVVDEVMGGTQSMEIYLDFQKQDALKDPKILNTMDKLQNYMEETHPRFVVKTDSLVNIVKNSYQVLNQDRQDMYIIPQERKALHQTLFMFDSANPDDRQLMVTDEYDRGRIAVRLKNYGSIEYLAFFDDIQRKTSELFNPLKSDYPDMDVKITGGIALMMKLVDYMSWSQIQSFGLALVVITIMLLFVFGSPRIGLMGMIPNLFPVAVTFGSMGFFGIPLDGDTLIIAPVVIGIAVDDTIHFLTHFRTEMLETGNVTGAIKSSIREVGQAISFSTIILVLGFLTLIFSSHNGMAHFGYLTAVAFISAWLADLFLLPSLCIFMKDKNQPDLASKLVEAGSHQ